MTQTLFDQTIGRPVSEPRVFSVSEFYEYANVLLSVKEVTVEGEISKIEVFKGYLVYFSINDKENVLPCLLYKNKIDLTGIPLQALEAGTRVRVTGMPNLYAKRGDFKLVGETIALVGEGALKKAFELLRKKLEEEGLFSPAVKRRITDYPERIGLITSRGAAAYTDFIKVINARWGGMTIYFYPASVQGETAIEEILKAFEYFNTSMADIDAVVLTRGGGSLEDLAAFNAELVARAVRGCKWPVVCAVGHERDESLAEYAADLRASTPSNAAELLVSTRQEERMYLESLRKKFLLHIEGLLSRERQRFERALTIMDRFFQKPKADLLAAREQVGRLVVTWLARFRQNLDHNARLLNSFDPRAVLKRGYSITINQAGRVIKTINDVAKDDRVRTSLYDGEFTSTVIETLNPKS